MKARLFLVVGLICTTAAVGSAGDWLRFRGPNGTGVSADKAPLPEKWSPTENLKWKTKLPGAGVSSPIVVGDKVFVTCYSGYGLSREDPGKMEDLKRHLVCIDRKTGKIVWDKAVKAVLPEDPYSGIGVPAHGYASHSPVSDGKHVFVYFGKTGAIAFDMDGKQVWQKSGGTGSDPQRWGSSSSPILFNDLLIVTASVESLSMIAFKKDTGEEVWRQEADGLEGLWGTPTLVQVDKDRTDLVVGVPYEIWGLNPKNGKLRWYCEAMESRQFNSSVVPNEGVLYAIEGRNGGSIAVKAGGKGDITKSNVVWSGQDSGRFGSPVVYAGKLYSFNGGIVSCLDTKTGKRLFQSRLKGTSSGASGGGGGGGRRGGRRGGFGGFGSADYASPVVGNDKVYYLNGRGQVFVIKASDKFEQLSVNTVTKDSETFGGTPAISDGQIFIRSDKHLYCVGK